MRFLKMTIIKTIFLSRQVSDDFSRVSFIIIIIICNMSNKKLSLYFHLL